MGNETVIEDAELVESVPLTDEAIQEELGILAGRRASRAFAERLGEVYVVDDNVEA